MERTITTKIKQCDLCKEDVKEFAAPSEGCTVTISRFYINIWYGGEKKIDICQKCSSKLLKLINDAFGCEF